MTNSEQLLKENGYYIGNITELIPNPDHIFDQTILNINQLLYTNDNHRYRSKITLREDLPMSIPFTDEMDIQDTLELLHATTISGRPGPCWLDVPMNLQAKKVEKHNWVKYFYYPDEPNIDTIKDKVLYGYFQSEHYFENIVEEIREQFKEPIEITQELDSYICSLNNIENCYILHVRLKDKLGDKVPPPPMGTGTAPEPNVATPIPLAISILLISSSLVPFIIEGISQFNIRRITNYEWILFIKCMF